MGQRELVALLSLSSWCLVIVVWLFLAVPWVCLQFVVVAFPDHTQFRIFPIQHLADIWTTVNLDGVGTFYAEGFKNKVEMNCM